MRKLTNQKIEVIMKDFIFQYTQGLQSKLMQI